MRINSRIQLKNSISTSARNKTRNPSENTPKHYPVSKSRSFHSTTSNPNEDKSEEQETNRHRSQYNYDPFSLKPSQQHLNNNLLNWDQLSKLKKRPRNARMLARDFIHDSLYNPNYGYFSKSAVLLPDGPSASASASTSTRKDRNGKSKMKGKGKEEGVEKVKGKRMEGEEVQEELEVKDRNENENDLETQTNRPFQFNSIKSENQFMKQVEQKYLDFEKDFKRRHQSLTSSSTSFTSTSTSTSTLHSISESKSRKESKNQIQKQKEKKSNTAKIWSAEGLEEAQERGKRSLQKQQNQQNEREKDSKDGIVSLGNSPLSIGMGIGARMDDQVDEDDIKTMAARQVWHTPTELFKPWYARSIARYLVQEYKHNLFPYDDLLIYELGAGSGSLAHGILNYLKQEEPLIFERTKYRIVEISQRLGQLQKEKLMEFGVKLIEKKDIIKNSDDNDNDVEVSNEKQTNNTREKVEIINQDFLEWNRDVVEPCFVVALEVLDNLAHDVVRYSTTDFQPYQNIISIDSTGDIEELYEPLSDPLISKYLSLTNSFSSSTSNSSSASNAISKDDLESKSLSSYPIPPTSTFLQRFLPQMIRKQLALNFPFYPNLTSKHFIPTNQLILFRILKKHFPLHRLIFSDFNSLPNDIDESISSSSSFSSSSSGGGGGIFSPSILGFNKNKGRNSPVVQTRIKGEMIPVTKFTVQQGYFDIFFPTDFDEMKEVYQKVMNEEDEDEDDEGINDFEKNRSHNSDDGKDIKKIKSQFDSEKILGPQKLNDERDSLRKSRFEPRFSPLEISNSLRSDYFSKSSSTFSTSSSPYTSTSTSSSTFSSSDSNHLGSNLKSNPNPNFDFFSPTSTFPSTSSMYKNRIRKTSNIRILNHDEFLLKFGEVEKTKLKDGSNPMVSWYQNAKWFLT